MGVAIVLNDALKEFPDERHTKVSPAKMILLDTLPPFPLGSVVCPEEPVPPDVPVIPFDARALWQRLDARNPHEWRKRPTQNRKDTAWRCWIGLKPLDKHILKGSFDLRALGLNWSKPYPDAKGVVWVWLPGYSEDKSAALVEFYVYGINVYIKYIGIYKLSQHQGKWRIQDRYLDVMPGP